MSRPKCENLHFELLSLIRFVRPFLELVKVPLHDSPALQQACSSELDVKLKFYENLWAFFASAGSLMKIFKHIDHGEMPQLITKSN